MPRKDKFDPGPFADAVWAALTPNVLSLGAMVEVLGVVMKKIGERQDEQMRSVARHFKTCPELRRLADDSTAEHKK